MTVLYRCDVCKELYTSPDEAVQCELECKGWDSDVANIVAMAGDPCNYCQHAYYVYGCEFDCKYYNKECNFTNKYIKFERKNKNE